MLIPCEEITIKFRKITASYLIEQIHSSITPQQVELVINHFQAFSNFSSHSSIFNSLWEFYRFLVINFPVPEFMDKIFNGITSFIEEVSLILNLIHIKIRNQH